eukprot:7621679-Ditylum_brightwellii.AAC.1
MQKEEVPSKLFEKLSGLQNRQNTVSFKIPDEDLIATVLQKAPKEYGMVLTCEQRTKGNLLTMNDLNETMSQLFRTLYGKDSSNEDNNEMGLSNTDGH